MMSSPVLATLFSVKILDFAISLVLVITILMVGCRRLHTMIRLFSLQSFVLVIITVLMGLKMQVGHPFILAGLTFAGKCLLIPRVLLLVMERVKMRREVESVLSLPTSMLLAGGLAGLSFYMVDMLHLASAFTSGHLLGLSIAMLLVGLFIMITRKKAFTEILGLYVMENGVYTLVIATVFEMPLIIEMGILLDLLIGVLVMGVWVFRIKQSFDTVNVDQLRRLKG